MGDNQDGNGIRSNIEFVHRDRIRQRDGRKNAYPNQGSQVESGGVVKHSSQSRDDSSISMMPDWNARIGCGGARGSGLPRVAMPVWQYVSYRRFASALCMGAVLYCIGGVGPFHCFSNVILTQRSTSLQFLQAAIRRTIVVLNQGS